jgi:FtsH-binding integral membrane protein
MNNLEYSHNSQQELAVQRFMVKVYGWMAAALMVTGFVALLVVSSEAILNLIFGSIYVFYGLIILELVMVGYLSGWIRTMSASTATLVFFLYACVNGLTLSFIFLIYTTGSIASTFFISSGTFALMSIYGYTTKSDLSKWGNILFMGLIGIIIASVVNIFMHSEMLYWITTYIGVLVFVGLTAYDTQKIKESAVIGTDDTETESKAAVMGALKLYLDFINLFLMLLRIFGRRK